MAQDFAKHRQARKPVARNVPRVPPRPAQRSHWGWYFSGMVSGAVAMVFAWYGYGRYQTLMQESPAAEALAEAQVEQPTFDFAFYNQLATAEVAVSTPAPPPADPTTAPAVAAAVIPPPAAAAAAQAATAEAPAANYLLQAGSFQARQDAENRRARIMLMNMEAQVSPGVVGGRTWYRVQVGPFSSRGGAEQARNELSANNIESIPLMIR